VIIGVSGYKVITCALIQNWLKKVEEKFRKELTGQLSHAMVWALEEMSQQ
jgi:hypothetical protein